MKTLLEADSREILTDVAFLWEKRLSDLFISYKTFILSSGAAERGFSSGYRILGAMKIFQSEENSQSLMLMKDRQHHVQAIEKEQ